MFRSLFNKSNVSCDEVKTVMMSVTNRDRMEWDGADGTPISWAVLVNRMDLAKSLVFECGFKINATVRTQDGFWSPLAVAVSTGNIEMMTFLVRTCGADVNLLNPNKIVGNMSVLESSIQNMELNVVKHLVEELGADVNLKLSVQKNGTKTYSALHRAIVQEIIKRRHGLNITKYLLSQGADLFSSSNATWSDKFILGIGSQSGNVFHLAKRLRNAGHKTDNLFALLRTYKKDQDEYEDSDENPYQEESGNEAMKSYYETIISEKEAKIMQLKNKLEQTVVQQNVMQSESKLTEHLSKAVMEGNIELVTSILSSPEIDVNASLRCSNANDFFGPVLLIALLNKDAKMIRLLVEKFEANVNQEIIWGGKQSTMIILAVFMSIQNNNLDMVTLLLDLDADTTKNGWMKMEKSWKFGLPAEHSLQWVSDDAGKKRTKMLFDNLHKKWNLMKLENLETEISDDLQTKKCKEKIAMEKMSVFTVMLTKSKEHLNKINELKQGSAFMSFEDIEQEKIKTKQKLEEPRKIISDIADLKRDPFYLAERKIMSLTNLIKTNQRDEGTSENTLELQCIICLEIPMICLGTSVNVFSCQQDHLVCQNCLSRIESCPICKQSFNTIPPRRNFLAEKMIANFQASSMVHNENMGFALTDLPEEIAQGIKEIQQSDETKKSALVILKEKLAKARELREQEDQLHSMDKYIPEDEIEMIEQKSDAKIEEALVLLKIINGMERKGVFLTKEKIDYFDDCMKKMRSMI